MKKMIAALLALCLTLACACALGEITVTKRDLALSSGLDKSVSNVLVLMQDGDVTDTLMIASINSKTGRSVMTRIACDTVVNVPEAGDVTLAEVYALGAEKSRGLLAARTVNQLLNLNVSTYVAMDIQRLPELVDQIGALNLYLNEAEAEVIGTWEGENALEGEDVLTYVRLRFEDDYEGKNRSYTVLMELLRQGLRSAGASNLMNLGKKLIASMDTNMNVLAAVTMVSSFQAGDDRRELVLTADMTAEDMREVFHREVYE